MDLWRISNFADLSGVGGLRASGRWHTRGRRIVYFADHPSSALLEMPVHMDRDLVPDSYRLLRVVIPDDLPIEIVDEGSLAAEWRVDRAASRSIGDRWLDEARTALLQVPSAISPNARNYLFNPDHPDASRLDIMQVINAPFDPRLI